MKPTFPADQTFRANGRPVALDCRRDHDRRRTRPKANVRVREPRRVPPAVLLFCCLFAAQASFLTLAAILPVLAGDLHVTLSQAGQLQTLAGLVGGLAALAITFRAANVSPERLLAVGLASIAAGSALSALAPSFLFLFGDEVLLGGGFALVVAGGMAAVPAWSTPEERSTVLTWAQLGQPGAWVIGMPIIGVVAHFNWRLAWIAVPLIASLAASALLMVGARRPPTASDSAGAVGGSAAWRRPAVLAWAGSELVTGAAWSGTLIYTGALLHDVYGLSLAKVGFLLGAVAIAYFPAALSARRLVGSHARSLALWTSLAAAPGVLALGATQPGAAASAALIAALMGIVGARGLAGSALGLQIAPDRTVEVSGLRAAAQQFAGLLGAALGGAALAAGGWSAWGLTFAALFVLGSLPHAVELARRRPGRLDQGTTSNQGQERGKAAVRAGVPSISLRP